MYLDIGLLLLICIFGLIGFAKGLLSQIIWLVSICSAFIGAFFLYQPVAEFVYKWLTSNFPRFSITFLIVQFASFVIVQVLIYFTLASILEYIKRRILNMLSLTMSDRMFGLIGGFAFGVALVLFLVIGISWTKLVVRRRASEEGYVRYLELLDSSQVYTGGMAVVGWIEMQWPPLSRIIPEEDRQTREHDGNEELPPEPAS